MYLEIFLADFAVFRVFLGISRDFAGQRPRESEALYLQLISLKKLFRQSIIYIIPLDKKKDTKINNFG